MHDAKGRALAVGDTVLLVATVAELHPTDDFCNVSLTSVLGRRPDGIKESVYAINTGVLIRANAVDLLGLDDTLPVAISALEPVPQPLAAPAVALASIQEAPGDAPSDTEVSATDSTTDTAATSDSVADTTASSTVTDAATASTTDTATAA